MFEGFGGHGLGSPDLAWVGAHIWGLLLSLALAGMMGCLNSVSGSQLPAGSLGHALKAMAEKQAQSSRDVPGLLRPRVDPGTRLLLLHSAGQSKGKSSSRSRGGKIDFTSLLKLQNHTAKGAS